MLEEFGLNEAICVASTDWSLIIFSITQRRWELLTFAASSSPANICSPKGSVIFFVGKLSCDVAPAPPCFARTQRYERAPRSCPSPESCDHPLLPDDSRCAQNVSLSCGGAELSKFVAGARLKAM
jgi:hypothetical protein